MKREVLNISARQSTLFNRMKSAKERYTKTKKALDTMLLNKLHSNGVYTPDQFHNTYVTRKEANDYVKHKLDGNNKKLVSKSKG